ncbi:uncharacterized protein LOC115428220 isoform X1 [Sphaeramia orbicularis]|uniref:uncharacterized protein LOC115428220 isoform X1 n=1 Tax=Sphaeramia orbicularis TaxID=375764 RepID=UPI001180E8AB|nr:uncharacterized protein LOC115428220 isoform X1 [Sphaeramia orbicularis]
MMRMNVYMCLSAFILSCRVCAEMVHMAVMEMNSVSLPCSYIMDNRMTWTKKVDGRFDFLFSVIGDEERRENDPEERFSSVGYNSLHINRVYLSDSGKYLCNNHWSVELTVIPTGTFIQHAREGTSVTLTCPHVTGSDDLIWRRQSDGWSAHSGLTLTLPELKPTYSGLFSCDGKPAVYLNVTTGDDEAPPTTTDTKTTSTSATTATTQKKTTSKTNNSKKGTKPEKKDKGLWITSILIRRGNIWFVRGLNRRNKGHRFDWLGGGENPGTGDKKTKPTKKPKVQPTTTTASMMLTKGAASELQLLSLIIGIPVLCLLLLLLLLLFIVCLISRHRLKRRVVTESHPVYEEIQGQVEFQAISGVGSSEMTAAYKRKPSPDVQILDHTYSMITFPSNSSGQIPHVESPYSLIGDPVLCGNNNGLSQLTDTYERILE